MNLTCDSLLVTFSSVHLVPRERGPRPQTFGLIPRRRVLDHLRQRFLAWPSIQKYLLFTTQTCVCLPSNLSSAKCRFLIYDVTLALFWFNSRHSFQPCLYPAWRSRLSISWSLLELEKRAPARSVHSLKVLGLSSWPYKQAALNNEHYLHNNRFRDSYLWTS